MSRFFGEVIELSSLCGRAFGAPAQPRSIIRFILNSSLERTN